MTGQVPEKKLGTRRKNSRNSGGLILLRKAYMENNQQDHNPSEESSRASCLKISHRQFYSFRKFQQNTLLPLQHETPSPVG